jgi:nitrogen fixation NifU-like protein
MYQEILLHHFKHPQNRGSLPNPDFSSGSYNPSCGDQITFEGNNLNGVITALKFSGKGCVISQATASLLSEFALSKSTAAIVVLDSSFILSLIGIPLGPTRLRCAMLSLEALQSGIKTCLIDQK